MSNGQAVYLDYNATTPVDPRVWEAMGPAMREWFGNPASTLHGFGVRASQAVERAREQVASLLGARGDEIVFTSGATESDNLAIKGVVEAARDRSPGLAPHVVTVATEHKAVLESAQHVARHGAELTVLDVDAEGRLDAEAVGEALRDETVLVSVMLGNNETGTLHDVSAIGEACRARGVILHTDATQAVGKVPVDVEALGADLLSVSAHKLYGPKGIGALYVRSSAAIRPAMQMHGGGHERGRRSGTLNVPGIVGFGEACRIAGAEREAESARVAALRDRFERALTERIDHVLINGGQAERLPNTSNVAFRYIEAEALLTRMHDVAASTGSACTTADRSSSHVLAAMGLAPRDAQGSVRFSLGRWTTREQIARVVEELSRQVAALRELSPLYEIEVARTGGAQAGA